MQGFLLIILLLLILILIPSKYVHFWGKSLKKIVEFFEVRRWKEGQKRGRLAKTACPNKMFCARHGIFEFGRGIPRHVGSDYNGLPSFSGAG